MKSTENILEKLPESLTEEKLLLDIEPASGAKLGYIELYTTNLATRGLFYQEGFRIFIRSANTDEVKHWASIDFDDPLSVEDALNYILTKCCEIKLSEKTFGSFKDVCLEDRLQIILSIRDLTYSQDGNKLIVSTPCPSGDDKCEDVKIPLNSRTIKINEVDQTLMSRYDLEKRAFVLKTKTLGEFILKSPTVEASMVSTKILKDYRIKNKKLDKSFLSILPYIVSKNPTDRQIEILQLESMRWTPEKWSFYINSIEKMRFVTVENRTILVTGKCEKCGSEVTAPMTFPDGLKSILIISNFDQELL